MGSCMCRLRQRREPDSSHSLESLCNFHERTLSSLQTNSSFNLKQFDSLILQTLKIFKNILSSGQDTAHESLNVLLKLSEKEKGWTLVISSLIYVVPVTEGLGPNLITMLIDECPLPDRDSILDLMEIINRRINSKYPYSPDKFAQIDRNICIVLGCLADKLAGSGSISLLTSNILHHILKCLQNCTHWYVALHALICLEKFSHTRENKLTITKELSRFPVNPLAQLGLLYSDERYIKQEIGFSAQWCLQNLFSTEEIPLNPLPTIDKDSTVILNINSGTEYMKISLDGLQARNDAVTFESVCSTFKCYTGVWYYEVTIISSGIMQIGWASGHSKFLNFDGYGVGDDIASIAYDGCRQLLWHNGMGVHFNHPIWKPGDVLGLLFDIDHGRCVFTLNGQFKVEQKNIHSPEGSGVFAAASLMTFQQCRFNFGATAFRFPPDVSFKKFNDFGTLSDEQRIIMPRPHRLSNVQSSSVSENCCMICYDRSATVVLSPCQHSGLCNVCADRLDICPVCREEITHRKVTRKSSKISQNVSQNSKSLEDFQRLKSSKDSQNVSGNLNPL